MIRTALLCSLIALGACGADGPPLVPTANLGIKIGPNGVSPSASVGASAGPVTVSVGN
ncbi:MAG: hypothetical protein ACWA40_07665 [Planktomarina sp.]